MGKRTRALIPEMRTRILWSTVHNLPLLPEAQYYLDLRPEEYRVLEFDTDVRPLFTPELQRLRYLVQEEFGSKSFEEIVTRSQVLLAAQVKQYVDDMKMVVADGGVPCYLLFDVRNLTWTVRLGPLGAVRAVHQDLVTWARLPTNWFRKGIYRISDFTEFRDRGTRQVVFLSRRGQVIGLGVRRRDKVLVVKKWEPQDLRYPEGTGRATWDEVLRLNEGALYYLTSRSLRILERAISKFRDRPLYTTYSGGKDSTVVLDLLVRSGYSFCTIFNDTGLEHPETYGLVEEVERRLGLEITWVRSEINFFEEVLRRGPPARDYRWCTHYLKVVPTLRLWKNLGKVLVVSGLRRYESVSRAHLSYLHRQFEEPDVVGVAPILDWCGLAEWLYILSRNLPYNPLYLLGHERLGCWMCPSSTLAEFCITEKLHPELWEEWCRVLRRFAERRGLPEEWVRYGLWRWVSEAPKKKILCELIRRPDLAVDYGYRVEVT